MMLYWNKVHGLKISISELGIIAAGNDFARIPTRCIGKVLKEVKMRAI